MHFELTAMQTLETSLQSLGFFFNLGSGGEAISRDCAISRYRANANIATIEMPHLQTLILQFEIDHLAGFLIRGCIAVNILSTLAALKNVFQKSQCKGPNQNKKKIGHVQSFLPPPPPQFSNIFFIAYLAYVSHDQNFEPNLYFHQRKIHQH